MWFMLLVNTHTNDYAEVPLDDLSREQKILLLKRLRSKLCSLVAALTAKQSGAPITRVWRQISKLTLDSMMHGCTGPTCPTLLHHV